MNHYKGPPAPTLKIIAQGNDEWLVQIDDTTGGVQSEVVLGGDLDQIVLEFAAHHEDYQPNVPVGVEDEG